jgi:IgA Peptidase M64/Secretion system C-terminal sorting domain
MKIHLILLLCSFNAVVFGQKFKIDTLQYQGDVNKYINIVLMGDGFSAVQQDTFLNYCQGLKEHMFKQAPFAHYRNYFNVFAIGVISQESGVKHPNNTPTCSSFPIPTSNPNNYFGSTFDYGGVHGYIMATRMDSIVKVLATHTPFYDQSLILVNTPYYGGMGGTYPVATVGWEHKTGFEVCLHEFGHSIGGLADEYWAGGGYEAPNMTGTQNPNRIRWKNWLGFRETGIYAFREHPFWVRPHEECKMRGTGYEFCPVCTEALVKKFQELTDPIVKVSPPLDQAVISSERKVLFKLEKLMLPEPNTLLIEWRLDGVFIAYRQDSFVLDQQLLSPGRHTLSAKVIDQSELIRDFDFMAKEASVVTWTIDRTLTSVNIAAQQQEISTQVFPNPASDEVQIRLNQKQKNRVQISLLNANGQVLKNIHTGTLAPGKHDFQINISNLPAAQYQVVFDFGEFRELHGLVKR